MEECKWNYKLLGYYIRFTKSNKLIILGQKEEQWLELVNINFSFCYKLRDNRLPYVVVHKGKAVRKGRCFDYYKCSSFTLISLYFIHIRLCPTKEEYLNLPQSG